MKLGDIMRKTDSFRAVLGKRGVRIEPLAKNVTPRQRTISAREWANYLSTLNDETFDAACVIDYGVGVFDR